MADPLSIVASVVGVAIGSAQLANTVYDFTDKYQNAPAQMQDVASEMSHLSSILSLLANVLREGQGTYKPQVLKDTESILDRVEKIQNEIKKFMKKNNGIRARFKWAMSSGKISELLDRIEALKSSLSILLATTQLALACRGPILAELETERLKYIITAGIKEIRQCVIGLQAAKPALMFEPPKLLHAAPVSGSVVPRTYRTLPIVTLPPPHDTSKQGIAPENTVDAMEPSGSQFETASWLYSMTLGKSEGRKEPPSYQSDVHEKRLRPQTSNGSNVPFSDARSQASTPDWAAQFQVTKAPPPQRLYEVSISSVARNLVGNWTYLNPSELFAAKEMTLDEQSDASSDDSSSDDDIDVPSSLHRPPGRTFTFEEYNRALETGDLHESSFQPHDLQGNRPRRKKISQQNRKVEKKDNRKVFDARHSNPFGPNEDSANDNTGNTTDERFDSFGTDYISNWSDTSKSIKEPPLLPSRSGARRIRDSHQPTFPKPPYSQPAPTPLPPHPGHLPYLPILPPPPAPTQDTTREDAILKKLNDLLLGKAQEEAKKDAEAKEAKELAKFNRLESLLIAQHESQIAKDQAKQKALVDAAKHAAEARTKADETSLTKLERLIWQQRDEQLKREAAADAARKSAIHDAEAMKKRLSEEKKAATEAAALLVKAAKREAEKEAEATKCAYEKALAMAKKASQETERELHQERMMRHKAQDFNRHPPLLQALYPKASEEVEVPPRLRAAIAHLVDVMHGKEEKKWYATADGPSLIDISDGYFARRVLDANDGEITSNERYRTGSVSEPVALLEELTTPGRYHLVFPAGAQQALTGRRNLVAALQDEDIEVIFEMNPDESKSLMLQLEDALTGTSVTAQNPTKTDYDRGRGDRFVRSSLLWQSLPKNGQSELYQSLCKTDWKPTYLRSSVSGQTWFYGERPVHVRFNRPDYVPRFAEFDMDDTHACIIVCNDIVDENALELTGVDYEPYEIGYWMLDPTLTYDDIEGLVAMSFALRETGLRRKARRAMNPNTFTIRTLGRFGRAAISPVPDFPVLSAFSRGSEPSEPSETSEPSAAAEQSSDEYESADSG